MCATLSDSIRHMNSIYKALNTPLMNPGIGVIGGLKATAASLNVPLPSPEISVSKALQVPHIGKFKAIANHTYTNRFTTIANAINTTGFSNTGIQAAVIAATSIPSLKSLTVTSNSLSRSISNIFNPDYLKTFSKDYSQIYDNALTTMRYFSTSNNYINLQWKKLINTELSDDFIDSFMNPTDIDKLSTSLGISEDKLRFMQEAINSANEIDDDYTPTVRNSNIPENDSANETLQNNQQQPDKIKNKKYQNITPALLTWLFILFVPTLFYIDGNIRNNKLEQNISTGIEMTLSAVNGAKDVLKK